MATKTCEKHTVQILGDLTDTLLSGFRLVAGNDAKSAKDLQSLTITDFCHRRLLT